MSSRGNPAMGDIARSVLVIGVIVLVVLGISRLMSTTPEQPTRPVEYRSAADNARTVADFDLLAPPSLPDGWRATSVRFDEDAWHLGVLTADEKYVGLEQVRLSEGRAVERFAEGSREDGPVEIAGSSWTRRSGPDDATTLLRHDGDITTLVTGSAPPAQVRRYVASLSSS